MTEPATLPEAIAAAAGPGAGGLVFHLPDGPHELPADRLLARARGLAESLRAWGIGPGDRVGVLGSNHPRWSEWAVATWCAGATLVPVPYPLRIRDPSATRAQIVSLARSARCRVILAEPALADLAPAELVRPWDREGDGGSGTPPSSPWSKADPPAVLQLTSGSTGAPKGAVISHRAVLASVGHFGAAYGVRADQDRLASWLPFFHDNGLFGYLVRPLLIGCRAHILPTRAFAADPAQWFRLLTETGGTITSGPASAWAVALRAAVARPAGIDLGSLRLAFLAAEAVDPRVVRALEERGPALGMDPAALASGYGMAETVLGVTGSRPGGGIRVDVIDPEILHRDRRAVPIRGLGGQEIASCGPPLPGAEVRIDAGNGDLPERHVGEVLIRTDSFMEGYEGGSDADPFVDGWLRSGDLGYVADGELFFTGRIKDVVIVMGRTYGAEELEWAAQRARGVRAGRVVAFAAQGPEEGRVVVAAEAADGFEPDEVAAGSRSAVFNAIGLWPKEVVVLERGSVPKTTSGKLRRSELRRAYLEGELVIVGRAGGVGRAVR